MFSAAFAEDADWDLNNYAATRVVQPDAGDPLPIGARFGHTALRTKKAKGKTKPETQSWIAEPCEKIDP